jgi:hypothetical protein
MAARRRIDDDDLDEVAAPRSDAYTGMLAISLGALITGCVLLYLDYSQYPEQKPEPPPAVKVGPPGGGQPPAVGGAGAAK